MPENSSKIPVKVKNCLSLGEIFNQKINNGGNVRGPSLTSSGVQNQTDRHQAVLVHKDSRRVLKKVEKFGICKITLVNVERGPMILLMGQNCIKFGWGTDPALLMEFTGGYMRDWFMH
jgi:hypothetical protein